MTSVRHWFAAFFVLGSCALFGISCAESTPKEAESPETEPSSKGEAYKHQTSAEAASGCQGDRPGQPRECKSNEDCCEGFLCSLDPERSRIVRYCLE